MDALNIESSQETVKQIITAGDKFTDAEFLPQFDSLY